MPAKSGTDLLFKFIKTGDLATTFDYFNKISQIILDSGQREHIHLALSNDFLTISLNDLGKEESLEDFIKIADLINSALAA